MSTLRSKLTNSVTNSRKISIWKNIAVQINSLGLHYRTDKEVKTKWQNMQTSAKKQYADRKKYATQTGGGPPAKKLSNETEKIVDMMKDCSSFVGLQGCESSINLTEGAYIIICTIIPQQSYCKCVNITYRPVIEADDTGRHRGR
jgi:hypothetical protein